MYRILGLLAASLLGSVVVADEWPQWRGPKRDGGTTEKVSTWTDAPKKAWEHPVGPGYSVPAIVGERVIVHDRVPEKEQERLTAYNLTTGKELWQDVYERPAYGSVLNTGPQGTPAVAGNRVYSFGITGMLSCHTLDTGSRVWQVDPFKKLGASLPRFGVTCSPLVVGNRVIVAVGGKGSAVAAFDTEKGELQWQALDESAGTASPVLLTRKGKLPDAVFMTSLRLVGLNPLDGKINWEHPLVFQPSGTAPTPLVVGSEIVASTMTNGSTLVKIDEKESKQVWQQKELAGYFSSGVAHNDRLYLVTNTLKPIPAATMRCVDRATGKEVWKKSIGYFHAGIIRMGDGKLLVLSDDGHLRLIEDAGTEAKELCKFKACGGTLSNPAFGHGHVIVRDDKNVTCYKLSE